MNLSRPEYIDICRKLPHHIFERGDYVHWFTGTEWATDLIIGFDLSLQPSIYWDGRIQAVGQTDPDANGPMVWLPHRESQWMQMKGWKSGWKFQKLFDTGPGKPHVNVTYVVWLKDTSLAAESDPLMACAKAWETRQ